VGNDDELEGVQLCVGDIVRDTLTGDIGVLLARVVRSPHEEPYPYSRVPSGFMLYSWRIWWAPRDDTLYTENGILRMIEEGRLILYKNT
jgi:hypothetical protein